MATLIDTVNPPVKSYPDIAGLAPEGIRRSVKLLGALHGVASGKRRYDYTTKKRSWPVKLEFLSKSQRDTLETDLAGNVCYAKFGDDTGTVYTFVLDPDSFKDIGFQIPSGTFYHVEFVALEQ